jgi:hypothetical protein
MKQAAIQLGDYMNATDAEDVVREFINDLPDMYTPDISDNHKIRLINALESLLNVLEWADSTEDGEN